MQVQQRILPEMDWRDESDEIAVGAGFCGARQPAVCRGQLTKYACKMSLKPAKLWTFHRIPWAARSLDCLLSLLQNLTRQCSLTRLPGETPVKKKLLQSLLALRVTLSSKAEDSGAGKPGAGGSEAVEVFAVDRVDASFLESLLGLQQRAVHHRRRWWASLSRTWSALISRLWSSPCCR